jgi:hypothetical protein
MNAILDDTGVLSEARLKVLISWLFIGENVYKF